MPLTAAQLALIRLEIADRGDSPQFDDAAIQAVYADAGSIGATVLALIEAQLAELSAQPDFTGGALRVSHRNRLAGLRLLLATKRNKYATFPAVVIDDDD